MFKNNAAYEAYKAGAVTLQDFVGQKQSREWGTTRYARSLTEILGKEEAKKWRQVAQQQVIPLKFDSKQAAHAWASSQYKGWQNGLSLEEQGALSAYKGAGYRKINDSLRQNLPLDNRTRSYIEAIDQALERARLPQAVTVYRGGGIHWIEEQGYVIDEMAGLAVRENGFTSTSLDQSVADDFVKSAMNKGQNAAIFEIVLPAGCRAGYMETLGPGECELLLPRGALLRIIEVRRVSEKLVYVKVSLRYD